MTATTIRVTGSTPAPADAVFRRLRDLDAHRDLAAPHIEILDLRGPRGARTGGVVQLNGPLGVQVRACTTLRATLAAREITGTARTDHGSTGTLTWRLEAGGDETVVTADLTARARSARDALLLAIGGRWWLRRRLATAIDRLHPPSG